MALRVGRLPYLHAEPFYFDMERRGIELHAMVPSALAAALVNGEIDAGPVPVADYFRLQDRLQPVAGFCVATPRKTGSIVLYSTKPIAELHAARIGVTQEAATASKLLDIVLRLKHQVQSVSYVPLQAPYDAFLLIGNDGLRQRGGARGFAYAYDLGTEWHAWTGLPFVFSRWVVRKDVEPQAIALLQDTLYVGLEVGVDALYGISEPREDLLMLPRDIAQYIRGFRYYIGTSEQRAIEQFRHYLQELER